MISISTKCSEAFICSICKKEIDRNSVKVEEDRVLKCNPCYQDSIHFPDITDETWKPSPSQCNVHYVYSKKTSRKMRGTEFEQAVFEALELTDSYYQAYSGYKVIWIKSTLFTRKQIRGFSSVEQAKIEWNLKYCDKKDKAKWIEAALIYNEKIKIKKE